MDLAHLNENKPLQITLLHNLGRGYTETGEAKKALETFEKGLALSQKTPKAPLQGELIKQISDAAFKTGNIPAALKYLVQGLEVVRKTNDPPTEGSLLIQLAEVHIHNQSEDQAMKYLEEALRACPIKSKTARWKERHCGYGARLCGKKGIWMKRSAGDRKL
jgi:tetratricopeptide (TPR) repeat protein